tara:strand:+ start:168 stop:971 length:804 start_codon:yes stop_codon:yes gene_type:complete
MSYRYSKGEQKIIYKKKGNIFNCYHVKVMGRDEQHISVIDLNDGDKEKTFNISRIVEVLDKSASNDLIDERLNKHLEDYKNRKLPSSFVHGTFFYKARGYIEPDGGLVLKLGRSMQTKERDIKVFKLLIFYFQNNGKTSMGQCKKFVKDAAAALLGYNSNDEFDDYDFSSEGKKDLIENYKEELEDNKDYLKELIQNCKDDGVDPNEDQEVIDLKKEIESDSRYLKVVRSDYRQELINFFCKEYYWKYEDSIFYDIARDFPIKFEDA